jgi:hypothetical protein
MERRLDDGTPLRGNTHCQANARGSSPQARDPRIRTCDRARGLENHDCLQWSSILCTGKYAVVGYNRVTDGNIAPNRRITFVVFLGRGAGLRAVRGISVRFAV